MKAKSKGPVIRRDEFWAAVDSARAAVCPPLPPAPKNGFTVTRYAERYGVSEAKGRRDLERMARQGALDKIMAAGPTNKPTLFYFPKASTKKQ